MEVELEVSGQIADPVITIKYFAGLIWYNIFFNGEVRDICLYKGHFYKYTPQISPDSWVDVQIFEPLVNGVLRSDVWLNNETIEIDEMDSRVNRIKLLPDSLRGGVIGQASPKNANQGCMCQVMRGSDRVVCFCNILVEEGSTYCKNHQNYTSSIQVVEGMDLQTKNDVERWIQNFNQELETSHLFWESLVRRVLLRFLRTATMSLLEYRDKYELFIANTYRVPLEYFSTGSAEDLYHTHRLNFIVRDSTGLTTRRPRFAGDEQTTIPTRETSEIIANQEYQIVQFNKKGEMFTCLTPYSDVSLTIGNRDNNYPTAVTRLPEFSPDCRVFYYMNNGRRVYFLYQDMMFYSTYGAFDGLEEMNSLTVDSLVEVRDLTSQDIEALIQEIKRVNKREIEEYITDFWLIKRMCEVKLYHVRELLRNRLDRPTPPSETDPEEEDRFESDEYGRYTDEQYVELFDRGYNPYSPDEFEASSLHEQIMNIIATEVSEDLNLKRAFETELLTFRHVL